MIRIVVASPVRQRPGVLREFLRGLQDLDADGCVLAWMFVDDNDDEASSVLLDEFARGRDAEILRAPARGEAYVCDDETHRWSGGLTERVALHKDRMLARALELGADAVLLVDSDLVLHPETLRVLRAADVDIVSEVFWTRWQPDGPELPNVWIADNYALHPRGREEVLEEDEQIRRTTAWLERLRCPGLHRVGGLGACTLVRRPALSAGVRFAMLPNLTWPGEDRHFCLRAAALGFPLWADTHLPPLHLYRVEDLARVPEFRRAMPDFARQCRILEEVRTTVVAGSASDEMLDAVMLDSPTDALELVPRANVVAPVASDERDGDVVDVELDLEGPDRRLVGRTVTRLRLAYSSQDEAPARRPRVVLSMIVRDEADRYLRDVLERVLPIIDEAVILDDGSRDGTARLCESVLGGVAHHVLRLDGSRFDQEHHIRTWQWRAAMGCEADWILALDADELLEPRAIAMLPALLASPDHDVIAFRLFDMWDPNHFREDELWGAHHRWWPMLARPVANAVTWRASNQHCGRWPIEIESMRWARTDLRVQHLGWMRASDRVMKHARYVSLDPDARGAQAAQYASILDPSPQLMSWSE